jgi:two-component system, CitB family, response regulator DctR
MAEKVIQVLLIEDDPMVQEVNKQFIENVDGFKVIDKAGNGKEGIEKVRTLKPNLVILDVYMPGQDGIAVLQQIREGTMDVDVIAVTAANDNETIRTILQNGAVDYIMKPFKFARMKQALENYKKYHSNFLNQVSMSQQELDEIILNVSTVNASTSVKITLPKGLNEATLQQILSYLQQQTESKSAEEVAEGVGLARVTARRYLEYLKDHKKIKLDIQYGGVGRPVNRYALNK